ncbi:MAG: Nif11 family protein [Deltaproteobacteria bacterium]|nr:Nif11 family protein [Deltaproteobacteria bacterium]
MSEESAQEFLIRLRDEPEFEKEAHQQGREGKILDWIRSQGYYFSEAEFAKAQKEFAQEGKQAEEESEPADQEAAFSSGSEEEKPLAGSETEEPSQNPEEDPPD